MTNWKELYHKNHDDFIEKVMINTVVTRSEYYIKKYLTDYFKVLPSGDVANIVEYKNHSYHRENANFLKSIFFEVFGANRTYYRDNFKRKQIAEEKQALKAEKIQIPKGTWIICEVRGVNLNSPYLKNCKELFEEFSRNELRFRSKK